MACATIYGLYTDSVTVGNTSDRGTGGRLVWNNDKYKAVIAYSGDNGSTETNGEYAGKYAGEFTSKLNTRVISSGDS